MNEEKLTQLLELLHHPRIFASGSCNKYDYLIFLKSSSKSPEVEGRRYSLSRISKNGSGFKIFFQHASEVVSYLTCESMQIRSFSRLEESKELLESNDISTSLAAGEHVGDYLFH